MIVLVCGGRSYADRVFVFGVLDTLRPDGIINGGAEGADRWAREWAHERHVTCTTVTPAWHFHGKAAGPIRNRAMIRLHPDMVVAFPGGRGTADLVAAARADGIKVHFPEVRSALEIRP